MSSIHLQDVNNNQYNVILLLFLVCTGRARYLLVTSGHRYSDMAADVMGDSSVGQQTLLSFTVPS